MEKFRIFSITTILFCKLFAVSWSDLPNDIKKCPSTNNDDCIERTMEEIFRVYPTGNPEFDFPNFSALDISNLRISRADTNSPIQISFEFFNSTLHGIEKANITRTIGFDKNLQNVELDATLPTLKLKGDYTVTGKLLILPINGKGKGELELRDASLICRVTMRREKRNNKTYFKIKTLEATLEPKQAIFKLKNLVNGNPVLSETLNEVINENWQEVWKDLQDGVNQAVEGVLTNVVDEIFTNLPLDEMYAY